MTADDRRDHLVARGYHVCRDAVVGGPVPVWFWCRCGLDRGSARNRGYIDVETGRWRNPWPRGGTESARSYTNK